MQYAAHTAFRLLSKRHGRAEQSVEVAEQPFGFRADFPGRRTNKSIRGSQIVVNHVSPRFRLGYFPALSIVYGVAFGASQLSYPGGTGSNPWFQDCTSPEVGSSPQIVPHRRYPGTSPPGSIPTANARCAVSGETHPRESYQR